MASICLTNYVIDGEKSISAQQQSCNESSRFI